MSGEQPELDVAAFRTAFQGWLGSVEIPKPPRDADAAFHIQRRWQKQLADAGWLGVDWPKEYGGGGLTALHQLAVMEELIAAGAPFPASVVNLYVVGPTLISHASHEQKLRYLPKLRGGDEIWCQGFSEPGAGSDLASLRTRARAEGEDFIVDGQKIWTSQAQYADFAVVLARTDVEAPVHKGITYLIVDMKSPGVTVRPIRQISGDCEFNEVFFDAVRVPKHNIVGRLNDGWGVAMRTTASERSSINAQRRAEAEAAFERVIARLRQTPELVSSDRYADIGHASMQLAVLDAQVRALMARFHRGDGAPGQESVDKLVLTAVEQEVFSLLLDLLGPYVQAPDDHPAGLQASKIIRDYFYSRSRSISAGTTQIQRNIVAQRVLGLPRS